VSVSLDNDRGLLEAELQSPEPPWMIDTDGSRGPRALEQLSDSDVDPAELIDLVLKLANTAPHFSTETAAAQLHLPLQIIDELLWQLKDDKFVEILGENGPFSYRYAITARGREEAARVMDFCGYIGPAPVALDSYRSMLSLQIRDQPDVSSEAIRAALSDLVLPESAVQVTELAVSAGRSLFLFGPAGNGKTSVAKSIHQAIDGEIWIPYAISVAGSVVQIFDPQVHRPVEHVSRAGGKIDGRWVKVRRPLIVAGGEMTIDALDLAYSPSLRYYESPLHLKANGGTFVIDDFGRQRIDPDALLNRWIIPLEHQIDHLTLHTGQKFEVPFNLMLVVATNLSVDDVADPAFLRRMGYRVHLDMPTPAGYRLIFERYASKLGAQVGENVIARLLERYRNEDRELRCCEPRDLIERVRDICRLHSVPFELKPETLDLAWTGYFGNM